MKVSGGQRVFEMDSGESGLRVEVQMPETLIAQVDQGDAVEVAFPSTRSDAERSYPGVVSEVGTRAGAGNAFPVRADLLESPPRLRPGMTAEVRFSLPGTDEDDVAAVPGVMIPMAAALAEADDRFSVFVYDRESSTVSKRSIQPGGVRDNDLAVIEGLEEGEIIATAGVTFLRDGQTVRLLREDLLDRAP